MPAGRDLPGSRGNDHPHDDFIHVPAADSGSFKGGLDGQPSQIGGLQIPEDAPEFPEGSACGSRDDNLFHDRILHDALERL
jgi:hypothetical protein